jgi:hypothetical protein
MAFRKYTWSQLAYQQVEEHGVDRRQAVAMARQSAPFTHPKWNRRFEGWALRIENELVMEFGVIPVSVKRGFKVAAWAQRCTICRGTLKMTFYEDHDPCEGRGCEKCQDGQVRVERRCPASRKAGNEVCSDALDRG